MKLMPYLHFNGNCEDALNTYIDILGGSGQVVSRFGDNPAFQVPDGFKNKVMHASLQFDGNVIMMSDTTRRIYQGNGAVMSINDGNEERIRSIFEKLAIGGEVTMQLEKQFWGSLFGQVIDKFGIHWMLSCP
jgi:PhnB protein